MRLDRTSAFTTEIGKIYFSIAGVFCCGYVVMVMIPFWNLGMYAETTSYISRIIAWLIVIFGMWLDFGMKQKTEKAFGYCFKAVYDKVKKHLKYYSSFILSIFVPGILIIALWVNEELTEYILGMVIIGMLIASVTILGKNLIYFPGEQRSKLVLEHNIIKTLKKNRNYIKGRYGRVTYLLLKDNTFLVVVVVGETVIWNNCEEIERDLMNIIFKQSFYIFSVEKNNQQLITEIETVLCNISNQRTQFLCDAYKREKERWERAWVN